MKKKLLALALAAIMACSLLAPPALAAEGEISCEVLLDGSLQVDVPSQRFSGEGMVQIATYSAQGRMLDLQSVNLMSLWDGYSDILSMKTEVGGSCKVFVLGGDGYQPRAKHTETRRVSPVLLGTFTKGADFVANSARVWDSAYPADYVGAEPMEDTSKIKFYVNGDFLGTQAVPAYAGDVTRLYDTDGDGKADTVDISRYHAAKVTGKVYTQQNSSGVELAYIPGVTGGFIPVSRIQGPYASVEEGDVVLYHTDNMYNSINDESLLTFEIAQRITGRVAAVDETGRLTVSGKTYDPTGIYGGNKCHADVLARWNDFENEYTFYLDKNGGICGYDDIIANNTAVVLESMWNSPATIDDMGYMQAKLLLASGDVVIAPIDKVGVGIDGSVLKCLPTDREVEPSRADRRVSYWTITGDASGDLTGSLSFADGFWHYQVNEKGNYELTNLALEQADFGRLIQIPAGQRVDPKPMFIGGEHANYANSSTLFLVEKYDAATDSSIFETFGGYINVPAMAEEDMLGGVCIHRRDVTHPTYVYPAAQYVYLKTTGYTTPAPRPDPPAGPEDLPEGLVFRVNGEYGRDADNYVIEIVDPEVGTRSYMVVDSLSYVNNAYAMYTVDAVSDGVVTAMTEITQSDPDKGITVGDLKSIGANVVAFEDGTTLQYDAWTTCILIDLKATPANGLTVSSSGIIDPDSGVDMDPNVYQYGAKLYVIADQDDLAHYVYIVRMLNVE